MNHLAHALLAGDDDALRLGGMLGDFVRGAPEAAWPADVAAGIRLHRAIDAFTDSHPQVLAAKARLMPPYRRYAGILLDMWFDHLLARDFGRWSTQSLDGFSEELRRLLREHEAALPPGLARFLRYMQAHGLPANYARPDVVAQALAGIGQRLRRDNPLAEALPVLQAQERVLGEHFEVFFPELREFAGRWVAEQGAGLASLSGKGAGSSG